MGKNLNKQVDKLKKESIKKTNNGAFKNKKIFNKKAPFNIKLTKRLKSRIRYLNKKTKRLARSYFFYLNHLFKMRLYFAYRFRQARRVLINIKLIRRNIFCSLVDLKNKKTLYFCSCGIYKIRFNKRNRKKTALHVLNTFFFNISKYRKNFKNTIFNITASRRFRKSFCYLIKEKIKKVSYFYFRKKLKEKKRKRHLRPKSNFNSIIRVVFSKCFNGCRAKKRVRLKRRRKKKIFKVL